jgi:uncharacterized glyoxalase superfamily protein PhnB
VGTDASARFSGGSPCATKDRRSCSSYSSSRQPQNYDELKDRGVEFASPPTEQFYGVEAVLKDPFGNWFSLTQPK